MINIIIWLGVFFGFFGSGVGFGIYLAEKKHNIPYNKRFL